MYPRYKTLNFRWAVSAVAICASTVAGAQDRPLGDTEREALIRLANEIARLKPMIEQAQSLADDTAKEKVRYDWILRDIDGIREGVLEAATLEHPGVKHLPTKPMEQL